MWWWRGKGISQTGFSFLLLVAPLEREMFMRQIIPFLSPAFYSLSGKHNFSSIDIPNSIVEAHWKGNRARAHSSNNNRSEEKKNIVFLHAHNREGERPHMLMVPVAGCCCCCCRCQGFAIILPYTMQQWCCSQRARLMSNRSIPLSSIIRSLRSMQIILSFRTNTR